jgi:hypothetical protein
METDPLQYIFPGVIAAQAIHAAVKLRIPDLLAAGPKTLAELAEETGTHPPTLARLLRALASVDLFERTTEGSYQNTPFSEILCTDHPDSHHDGAMFLPAPFLWRPLGELTESVRTGEPSFNRIYGESFFEYLAGHAEDAALFNRVMTQGIAFTSPALLEAYDFSHFERLVDVGGGQGALLREILAATPRLHGVLFDLPKVVEGASEFLDGVFAERSEIVGGSFFDSVPAGADAYLLKGVIHDWGDDEAIQILSNVRKAIRPDGTLLLVESLVDSEERPAGLGDLLMLVIGGRDRSETDIRTLLALAGFTQTRIIPAVACSIIESRRA